MIGQKIQFNLFRLSGKKCVSIGPGKKKLPKIANGKCYRCTLAWCDAYLQLRAKETTKSALNSGRLEK